MNDRPNRARHAVALVMVAGFAAACADRAITSPLSPVGPGPRADAAAAPVSPFHPNDQKYSDQGAKPATGRSGSASIAARALLARDGTTLIEATTGQLDATAAPPGMIAKAQLKSVNAAGDVIRTMNFTGLAGGGYWSYTTDGLSRGNPLQVQTNVRGIDPPRTDVVTVRATVKRRPDLAVQHVANPGTALINTDVDISAVVAELNGDVGARADCVLSVDGQQVDQALGIWVDAGHTVSCAFTTRFSTVGRHALAVTVGNVVPGDWDLSNNSASSSIMIDVNMPWSASAYSGNSSRATTGHYNYNDCFYFYGICYAGSEDYTYGSQSQYSGFSVSAYSSQAAVQFPINVTFDASTDGTSLGQVATTAISPASGSDCVYVYDGSAGASGDICSRAGRATYASFARYAGAVTYHSYAHGVQWTTYQYCYYAGWGGYTCSTYTYTQPYQYSYNYGYASGSGPVFTLGQNFRFDLAITDASGGTFRAGGSSPVTTESGSSTVDNGCYNYSVWYTYSNCSTTASSWSRQSAFGVGVGNTN